MTPIEKLLSIAKNEVGYLEKETNNNLIDKKTNAGDENYTKYWADLYPKFQGQPWCAIFVTWCFVQAFGVDMTKKLLKHFPFTYCPTLGSLFPLNANPKVGDIVLFYSGGRFSHTGIVQTVEGDYFTTIEGNTSADKGIIPNGGGVSEKGYYNSKLPGTKFVTVDWNLVEEKNNEITEEPVELEGLITAYSLNVREKPFITADIIKTYSLEDVVSIIAKTSNNWYKVKIDNNNCGYISGKYVITSPAEELTKKEFNKLLNNYIADLAYQSPSPWSQEARTYCENNAIINGDENGNKKYKAYLTREELAAMLFNIFGKKDVK